MQVSTRHKQYLLVPRLVLAMLLGLAISHFGGPGTSAAGTNYYVDSINGSDANSGTSPSTPWGSLTNVNNRSFGPGDVINLARGSSWTGAGGTSSTLIVNGAGASGSPITVQPYGSGAAPILRNPSTTNSRAVSVAAPWVVVQGLMVRDTRDIGIFLMNSTQHTIVRNNTITQVGVGVEILAQYNLVTGNDIHDLTMVVNDPTPNNDYGANGVMVKASNNEISYNRLVNCKAPSIDYGYDGGAVEFFGTVDNVSVHHNYSNNTEGFIEVGGGSAQNTVVAYNVIVDAGSVVGLHLAGPFASVVSNFQFANNTVVDAAQSAYSLYYIDGTPSGPGTFIVRNNIFYVNQLTMLMQGSTVFTHDHNLYYFPNSSPTLNYPLGTGERVVNPLLANVAAGDYHLQAASPAIDAGAASLFNVDFAGTAVPSGGGVDIGAYEYASQPAPAPTPTPVPAATNLLQNGSFESSLTPWRLQVKSPAYGSLALDTTTKVDGASSGKVTIATPTSAGYYLQLKQDGFNVIAGRQYRLTFYAKASVSRSIEAVVQGVNSPYTVCGSRSAALTTSWQQFTLTFQAGANDSVFAGFNLAANGGTVWVDGVSLTPL